MKIVALSSVLKSKATSLKMTDSRNNTDDKPFVRRFSSNSTVKRYTNFNSLKLENMDFLSKLQNTKLNVLGFLFRKISITASI